MMSAGPSAAAALTTAEYATRCRRTMHEEEETMTAYTEEDLQKGWEFKIVRAVNGRAFRKPEDLQQLIDREARADWVMLEKFDDQRVRFKRRITARWEDPKRPPDVNPYATHFGIRAKEVLVLISSICAGTAVALLAGYLAFS